MVGRTPNGMEYEYHELSLKRINCILEVTTNVHSVNEIDACKFFLRERFGDKLNHIQIRMHNPDMPIKIPDEAIIKMLQQKIGEQASYIEELKEFLQRDQTITKEDRTEFKKEKAYKELVAKLKVAQQTIRKLRKDNEYLIIKLNTK
jgi:hypothetical protein